MISGLRWRLRQWARSIWGPVLAFAALGVLTALAAVALRPFLPEEFGGEIGVEAVDQLLNILATSMLGVTTFSVSIMVTAFASTGSGATPRAITLMRQDRHTRYVLAIFIGAFVFSLVGIIGLSAGIYSDGGRAILFFVTIAVFAVIVVALMRWIAHLTVFGRLVDTLDRVEAATLEAMRERLAAPLLGGAPAEGPVPKEADHLMAGSTGHVQHVDMPRLGELAQANELTLFIEALPGRFVHPQKPLIAVIGLPEKPEERAAIIRKLTASFTVGRTRSFDQDPVYGFLVLTEIASRALSPATNDLGTAIDVLNRHLRLMTTWAENAAPPPEVKFPRLFVPSLTADQVLPLAIGPIARDGANMIEVQRRVQSVLRALAQMNPTLFATCAAEQAARAADLAATGLALETDRELIRKRAEETRRLAGLDLVEKPS